MHLPILNIETSGRFREMGNKGRVKNYDISSIHRFNFTKTKVSFRCRTFPEFDCKKNKKNLKLPQKFFLSLKRTI